MKTIPERILGSIERYRDGRIPPGQFLTAVLENNLLNAIRFGDDESIESMRSIVVEVCKLPSEARGSRENVKDWLAARPVGDLCGAELVGGSRTWA